MSYPTSITRSIVVIGGGIVGSALAAYLSENDGLMVTVLEAGPPQRLVGSTEHAPGFHGLLNASAVATELARASADEYGQIRSGGPAGFDRVGGLEVATTLAGMADAGGNRNGITDLEHRAALARNVGLPAQVLDPGQAVSAAPDLVNPDRCVGGVFYAYDGTTRADLITATLRARAALAGVQFVCEARVAAIETNADRVTAARTATATFPADDVVVACGIWDRGVLASVGQLLPLTPVAHPYLYGPAHGEPRASAPFVRWPEQHVYARDHGDRFGLGTYDHRPLAVGIAELGTDAEQPWIARVFDPAIETALDLLPVASRFSPERRLNGVFFMIPRQPAPARPDGGHRRVVAGRGLVGHPCLRRSASIGSDDDRTDRPRLPAWGSWLPTGSPADSPSNSRSAPWGCTETFTPHLDQKGM